MILSSLAGRLQRLRERWDEVTATPRQKKPPDRPERQEPPSSQKPLTASTKKMLATSVAAMLVNLTSSVGALFPAIMTNNDFLEVTTFPKNALVDSMNLEGFDVAKFVPAGSGDLQHDVRFEAGRRELQQHVDKTCPGYPLGVAPLGHPVGKAFAPIR